MSLLIWLAVPSILLYAYSAFSSADLWTAALHVIRRAGLPDSGGSGAEKAPLASEHHDCGGGCDPFRCHVAERCLSTRSQG